MTGRTGILTRSITRKECFWLHRTLPKGLAVFEYLSADYGCCTDSGVMVLLEPQSLPAVELPKNAVEWL